MLSNVIGYRGCHAQITYDPSADAFHGRVLGMQDAISSTVARRTSCARK
jgi:predicted HicB family RNase H-like nuclease